VRLRLGFRERPAGAILPSIDETVTRSGGHQHWRIHLSLLRGAFCAPVSHVKRAVMLNFSRRSARPMQNGQVKESFAGQRSANADWLEEVARAVHAKRSADEFVEGTRFLCGAALFEMLASSA
jgi:hypothetical protein